MHSRLPLIAGVPGRISVAALTVALLASGCAPHFHSPEPTDLEPASASHALPAAVQNTAETTMRQAADVVIHRVIENHPAPEEPAAAGEVSEPETEDPAASEQNDDDAADEQPTGSEQRRESLEDWSASLTRAHDTAQESRLRDAEADAERQEEPEQQEEPEAEAEQEPDEPPEVEDTPEPHTPEESEPADPGRTDEPADPDRTESEQEQEPSPPAVPEDVPFTGDLNAYLAQLADSHPGRISISVQEVGGQGRSGSTGGSDSFVTASTYKLLVAYSIIREVEAGTLSWDDAVLGDRSLAQCFSDMIALSDNPCPEKLGPQIGWAQIYSDAAAMGAGSTGSGEGGIRTNAMDLTRFMTNLATGGMAMSDSGHERLRNALAANIHRQGIPAGSAGQVLNKPGFINGNLHDTAIVYHPSGTYVLTVLSQGSSWGSLASITSSIESALYG